MSLPYVVPSDGPVVVARALARSFGDVAVLEPIDLELAAGECLAVLGENGSGKTVLLRAVTGADSGAAGTVWIGGHPVVGKDPFVHAFVPRVGPDSEYTETMTVAENLELVAREHGAAGAEARAMVAEVLEEFALTERARHLPDTLSTGELQAMLLCTAFVRPRLLVVLDEPERALDAVARDRLVARLRVEKAAGVGVLMSTHLASLARRVADHVVVLDEGKVTAQGAMTEVLGSPS